MKFKQKVDSSSQGLVKAVHAGVRGRIRLEVSGLYRSPPLKEQLEGSLTQADGICSAEANVLTGRLLVIYGPGTLVADVVERIESELCGRRKRRVTAPRSTRPLSSFRVSSALAGFGALLRGFSASFTPTATAAAAVGAPALGQQDKQPQEMLAWHMMDAGRVLAHLGTSDQQGLGAEEAGERLRLYGANSLAAGEKRSDLAIFVDQFISAPVGLLGASAVVALMTGGVVDAAVILGVVLINSVIGFITERQAEKTISSLSETGVREVNALRDGVVSTIPVEAIVPGDVLVLTPGTYVAADIRLLNSHRLSVDESALTGESLPVAKEHDLLAKEDTALGDRKNMAYMGTHVTGGNGRGVVIATAEATELGQIQTLVGEAEAPETPMQRQLDRMGTTLAIISGGVCAGVFGVGVLRGFAWIQMLKSSVSLAVAAVPEGLPAVATTTLAMGIADMRKLNVAVRHLDAVETLGSVQVFCMDKTGTLTMNRMAVVAVQGGQEAFDVTEHQFTSGEASVDPMDRDELVRLMQVVSLCSETEVHGVPGDWRLEGSPTENALVDLALNAGIDVTALREESPKLKTRYRAEGRPFMSTLHPYREGKHLLAVKGSPEEVLGLCDHQIKNGRKIQLTNPARQAILAENERMASDALRVLGVAYRELDEDRMPDKTEHLVWLGLAGMADPMRPGMDKLIAQFHTAGIQTIMITGDQSATAQAIGKQLGLSGDRPLQVLESSKLEEMDPDLLAGLVKNVHVFARVSPAHKLKIVRALQEAGYVVAMTGDGINDGPALKASDIGVAMGAGGTNVAREVSDVVLEDDNLHTMSIAVRQGRTIYNNIRKMIHFMVSTNLTEIEVMLAGFTFNMGEPMNPMQLLWINLVTDIFPGLALALEPAEPDIMERVPRDPEEAIIAGRDLKRMIFESGTIGLGTFGAYMFGLKRYGIGPAASTLAFNTLTLNELAHALSSRSKYRNVFGGQKLPPNRHLTAAIGGMAALQAVVSLVPAARGLLGTTPLGIADLGAIGAGVLLPLIANEATKPGYRKGTDGDSEAASERTAGDKQPKQEEIA
ncbi:MAG: HAD-IC family P-type ATPase [Pseudomonadota bacterium]|nr:HAD-IC family P-type ATPase [Pseudomonadota bacterium]